MSPNVRFGNAGRAVETITTFVRIAAAFMQRFYFHWLSQTHNDPAVALRDAQAEYANAPNKDATSTSFIIVGQ